MAKASFRKARRWVSGHLAKNASRTSNLTLDLGELISPLRLDVLVRASLFEVWSQDWDYLRTRPDEALEIAAVHPYSYWFDELALSRVVGGESKPEDRDDHFSWRVRRSHALLDKYINDGFDERHPVTVRFHEGGTLASGKVMGPRAYPVDGCHRLALMWLEGVRTLGPSLYRLAPEGAPPIDNTHTLLQGIHLDESKYCEYMGLAYGLTAATTAADLFAAVPEEDSRRRELDSALAIDGIIGGPGVSTPSPQGES